MITNNTATDQQKLHTTVCDASEIALQVIFIGAKSDAEV